MSTLLLAEAITYIRGLFSNAEVREVRAYAGEFNAAEVKRVSFNAPTIMVALLGWRPERNSKRLSGRYVMDVRLSAFVVTKRATSREARMAEAASLAERLAMALTTWTPISPELLTIAPLEAEPTAENLYGQAIDLAGLALWMVDWRQCVKPTVPLPELFDLLRVEITDHTVQGAVPADAGAPPTPITVTEDVQFNNLPPTP